MRKSLLSLMCVFATFNLFAQDITGDWYGTLEISAKAKLHVVFHVKNEGTGYSTTMDSPDQGAKDIKTDTTSYEHNELTIAVAKAKMKYTGTFDKETNTVKGTFSQGPNALPLVLKRTKEETVAKPRPQDPVDFPYLREEVTFENKKDSVTLAGTLTLPKDKKADKLVILISGSGPQNRNEELTGMNHRPFLVWADWLTRNGIAVLRYDDRGIGKSTGSFNKATSADFANDAEAAVEYVKSRADLKDISVGLMGHSEGGMIAPMVASRDKRVAFIVLLAGPGIPCDQILMQQSAYSQTAQNVPKEIAALNTEITKMSYTYLKQHSSESNDAMAPGLRAMLTAQMAKYPADAMKDASVEDLVNKQMKAFAAPWFRYFVSFDPAVYLTKVKCPVLAINGTLDRQVFATENLKGIEDALKKGKNKHYEIRPTEGLNHLLQKATTGSPSEYGDITETVNQAALDEVVKWVEKQ